MNQERPTSPKLSSKLGQDIPSAAYVHVPFCAHRCGYCDFTLIAGRDDLIDDYLIALEKELKQQVKERQAIDTLFLGGGTPSHLPADALRKLFDLLLDWFDLQPDFEFSIEVNPAGLPTEKMDIFQASGINRVSLGLQSFDDEILQTLERDHRQNDIEKVVAELQARFQNISFDLIFGVPGESKHLWEQTLAKAISLKPQHISTYGLTFEKGTDFWKRREKGTLIQHTEEVELEMYRYALEQLPAAGYQQYEISNFAQPVFECRHNQTYWNGFSYYGLGPGAASYLNGIRSTNRRSVTHWLKKVLAGESGVGESEELSAEEKARELSVIQLRTETGVPLEEFRERSDYDLMDLSRETLLHFEQSGWVEINKTHVFLTAEGKYVADSLVVDLL